MQKHIRDKALGIGDFHMKTRLSSQKLRMTEDPQLIDCLLILRFGTNDVGKAHRPVLNFASISKVVRKHLGAKKKQKRMSETRWFMSCS